MEALSLASPPLDNESPSSSSSSRMPGATESGQTERVQLPKMHRAEMRSIEHPDRELIKTCRRHQTERTHTLTQDMHSKTHVELHSQNQCSERKGSFFRTLIFKLLIWSRGMNLSFPPENIQSFFSFKGQQTQIISCDKKIEFFLTSIRGALVLNRYTTIQKFPV